MNWLNLGDKNTKFFHQSTLQRRKRNKILRIKRGNNEWIEDEKGVIKEFEDYF